MKNTPNCHFSGKLDTAVLNLQYGRGGENFVPTSEVIFTPPEREQSARPGTGTEVGLGLG